MKQQTRVVIIGGGVTGCGLAYHLTKLGWSDIAIVEKNELTAGATWHAAGHVMHFSSSELLMRLQKETTDLLPVLERETGQSVGFHRSGAIRLITQPTQMVEYRRVVAMADALGVDVDIISPAEAGRHFPLMKLDGLLGAAYTPGDGHVDPSSLTYAYAKGARMGGVEINTQTMVTGLTWRNREWEISTNKGSIRAEIVVNCAGMWAPELTAMVGVGLPLIVFMHQHLVTEDHPAVAALGKELALMRDPIGGFNCRQEGKSLLSGVYEHAPEFVFQDGIPPAFGKELMAPNFERSADFIARAIERVPALGEVGIKMVYNGPTSRTPDHQPLLGPLPGVRNYFIAAGYAAGFVQAGFTRQVAQWIVEGEPDTDMSDLDVRRFGAHATRGFTYSVVHAGHAFSNLPSYPYGERSAGRPARTSALHDRLASAGAVFGVRNGWEVPNWFARDGAEGKERLGFFRPNWFDTVGEECRRATAGVGILDLSYASKFEISGPGSMQALDWAFACRLPQSDGQAGFGPMLTANGGIATCMTIVRLSSDRFLLLGPGEFEARDIDDLWRRLPNDGSVRASNISGQYALLLVTGARAPDVLGECARADLYAGVDIKMLKDGAARRVALGFAPTLVIRQDLTGQGDWLVLVSMDFARSAYDSLYKAGASCGAINLGVRAWDALRLEQGIGTIGLDIDRTLTPTEAGLTHLINIDKGDFFGKKAMTARAAQRHLVKLTVESGAVDPYRNDLVSLNGRPAALVRTGGHGHLHRSSLAFVALPSRITPDSAAFDVEIFGKTYKATTRPRRDLAAG
ncbi:MAG: GcvT family protein [Alphaproteobacteria bacterium]|nr:GcvT family protein [Alphaproteobacteria bacterium]